MIDPIYIITFVMFGVIAVVAAMGGVMLLMVKLLRGIYAEQKKQRKTIRAIERNGLVLTGDRWFHNVHAFDGASETERDTTGNMSFERADDTAKLPRLSNTVAVARAMPRS